MLDGYVWRKKRQEETLAFFTCHLLNVQLQEPITPAKLLEPLRGGAEDKKKSDAEYLREKFKKVIPPEGSR